MHKFSSVVAFEKENANLKKAIEVFAKEELANKKMNRYDEKRQMKLEKINKAFAEELSRRSGVAKLSEDATETEAVRYVQNPQVQYYGGIIRDEMIDTIIPLVIDASTLSLISEVKYADLRDTISFTLKNNALYNVSKASLKKRDTVIKNLKNTTITLEGENHQITVDDDLVSILVGGSFVAEDIMKAVISMEQQMYAEAYSAFTTAFNSGNINANLRAVGFSDKSLLEISQKVQAYNHAKPVIVGTLVALQKVLPDATVGARFFENGDFVKVGYLPQYKGLDVIPFEQVIDVENQANYGTLLDDTKLYIVTPSTDKIVKIGIYVEQFLTQIVLIRTQTKTFLQQLRRNGKQL